MQNEFQMKPVGFVHQGNGKIFIQIESNFISALLNLDRFSHLLVLWWAHLNDNREHRKHLILEKLFRKGPDRLGVFATRSPIRPNPIMISMVKNLGIEHENGKIQIPNIDAENNSPVLDIKPYFPMDRVKSAQTPTWCQHWPQWFEDSAEYNWKEEMNI